MFKIQVLNLKKEKYMKRNYIYFIIFIVFSAFIILISACEDDITTTASSGGDASSALPEASNVTVTGSPTDINASISWQIPTLTASHKKPDGTQLTKADISYKVYRVAKGGSDRTVAEIKAADKNPITVAKGATSITIPNLKPTTTYEVVVQAINFTDTTKTSTGIRIEVTTPASIGMKAKEQGSSSIVSTVSATAQGKDGTTEITPIVMEVTPSSVVSSGTFSISPNLTENTGISFNTSNGTLSGVAKYAQSETAYTVTFTATDGRTAQITLDITVVHKHSPKNKKELIDVIISIIDTHKDGDYTNIDARDDLDADLNIIDTSNITDMSILFSIITPLRRFNGDISKWDVSNVTNMYGMFHFSLFNGDISKWDVSNVTNMNEMFKDSSFNKDLEAWGEHIEESVTMSDMFDNSAITTPPTWYKSGN